MGEDLRYLGTEANPADSRGDVFLLLNYLCGSSEYENAHHWTISSRNCWRTDGSTSNDHNFRYLLHQVSLP